MEDEGLQERLKSELLKVAEEDSHSSLKSSMLSHGGRLNQRSKAMGMEVIEEEEMSFDGNDLSQLTKKAFGLSGKNSKSKDFSQGIAPSGLSSTFFDRICRILPDKLEGSME